MRPNVEQVLKTYKDSLFRTAFCIVRNPSDAEDVVSDVLLKYMDSRKDFENEEHLKAWLIRATVNRSRDMMTAFWRRKQTVWDESILEIPAAEPEDRELIESVLRLPERYREAIYLYYYEDYSVVEIASMLKVTQSAIKTRLQRGRAMLKEELKEDL
jgi:RNA polymerase sigma-70 factor (ECF subfamily)